MLAFCWVAKWHSILTIDKLKRRNHIRVNGYPTCLQNEETVHHLAIHCSFPHSVWSIILNLVDLRWVMRRHVDELFCQWRVGGKFVCGKILWKLVLYATFWKIWLERNNRVFQNKSHSVEDVVDSIVWSVSEWVRKRKEFNSVDLFDLNRSWAAICKGGGRLKSKQKVSWMSPPMGILKLNFDESFVKSLDKGGIGGVIRDWSSKIVRSFSGPVESSDTNEAEVFALLISCRELSRLGGVNATIEGDSFSTIQ